MKLQQRLIKIYLIPYIALLIVCCFVGIFAYEFFIPTGVALYKKCANAFLVYRASKNFEANKAQIVSLKMDIKKLDSLDKVIQKRHNKIDNSFINKLYIYADSTNFNPSKIEIYPATIAEDRCETGIFVKGNGNYKSIGHYCAALENVDVATRIRQLVLTNENQKTISMTLDLLLFQEKSSCEN